MGWLWLLLVLAAVIFIVNVSIQVIRKLLRLLRELGELGQIREHEKQPYLPLEVRASAPVTESDWYRPEAEWGARRQLQRSRVARLLRRDARISRALNRWAAHGLVNENDLQVLITAGPLRRAEKDG